MSDYLPFGGVGNPEGMLHHWTFDDVLTDEIDAGFTWVPNLGSAQYNTGVFNNGTEIQPAVYDELEITGKTVAAVDGGGSFSATTWYRPVIQGSCQLFRLIEPAVATKVEFLNNAGVGASQFTIHDTGASGIIRAAGPEITVIDQWTFFAGVYDDTGSGSVVLYQGTNGADLVATVGTPQFGWNGTRDTLGTVELNCGFFTQRCILDDFRIYPFVLSVAQVQDMYDWGKYNLGI